MMEMMLTMCTEMRLLRDEKMHQNAYETMSKIYHHTHNYFNGIILMLIFCLRKWNDVESGFKINSE